MRTDNGGRETRRSGSRRAPSAPTEPGSPVSEQNTNRPLFLFVNVSATHVPHGHYTGDSVDSWRSQAAALAYADEHLGRLVDGLTAKKRWLIIMCADHGDAFGEDGYHGRGIAHPTVLNVPFAAWLSQ
ncbi:sulfatase-like hydrolase/transferase [Streptomyces sp. NBC_00459]|uniref:sulfatase-like hydrolase/transferase n=1 Tax=Streptomyces sp. NBC_00459 TaxID=2975749 RepID=UPI002E17B4C2